MHGQTACRTRRLYTRVVNKRGIGVGKTAPGSGIMSADELNSRSQADQWNSGGGLYELPLKDLLADVAKIRQGGIVGRDE